MIEPYHLDEMVTVMDVREAIDCNWKVVMDAFQEGYHIHGIHPQLLSVIAHRPDHEPVPVLGATTGRLAPFEVPGASPEEEVDGIWRCRRRSRPSPVPPALRGTGRAATAPTTGRCTSPTASPPGPCCNRRPARP